MSDTMIKQYIKTFSDFPVPGVDFKDSASLCSGEGFHLANNYLYDNLLKYMPVSKIIGIDARGFIFASVLAHRVRKPLILARKSGKLPGATVAKEFELEYGTATLEIQKDSISTGDKLVIIDDLMATGGTVQAVIDLVNKQGAQVSAVGCVMDLKFLGGADKVRSQGIPFYAAAVYD